MSFRIKFKKNLKVKKLLAKAFLKSSKSACRLRAIAVTAQEARFAGKCFPGQDIDVCLELPAELGALLQPQGDARDAPGLRQC